MDPFLKGHLPPPPILNFLGGHLFLFCLWERWGFVSTRRYYNIRMDQVPNLYSAGFMIPSYPLNMWRLESTPIVFCFSCLNPGCLQSGSSSWWAIFILLIFLCISVQYPAAHLSQCVWLLSHQWNLLPSLTHEDLRWKSPRAEQCHQEM